MSEAEKLVGQTVAGGRYVLLALLGEGGMGAVFTARQVAMDRIVALKLIRPEMAQTPGAVGRFQNEMRAMARVEHPSTVRVYDFGQIENGQLYLTMELLQGVTLGAVMERDGRLAVDRIVRIGRQIANAVGAAHERGIVHRDLKPENVMLTDAYGERELVKVVDFGIAKSLEETDTKLTATGAVIGTPAYMAPEQALGKPLDGRTDLYSLGVMLYQMASGRVPFHAPTTASLLVAHAIEEPPPLEGVQPQLAALILALLAKEPADRPATAAETVARLDACLGPPRRKRGRVWLFAAGAVMLAAVGGVVAAMLGLTPAQTSKPGKPVASAAPAAPAAGSACATLVQKARDLLAGDGAASLAAAEHAVKTCPADGGAENARGNALQRLGRLEPAEDAYVRALALDPGNDAPRFNLGLLQLRRKDASATATFTELLRRNPAHPDAHLARAQAYLLAGKPDDALADLEEAVKRKPDSPDAWAALGQLRDHLKKGDAQAAYCRAKALGAKGVSAFCP